MSARDAPRASRRATSVCGGRAGRRPAQRLRTEQRRRAYIGRIGDHRGQLCHPRSAVRRTGTFRAAQAFSKASPRVPTPRRDIRPSGGFHRPREGPHRLSGGCRVHHGNHEPSNDAGRGRRPVEHAGRAQDRTGAGAHRGLRAPAEGSSAAASLRPSGRGHLHRRAARLQQRGRPLPDGTRGERHAVGRGSTHRLRPRDRRGIAGHGKATRPAGTDPARRGAHVTGPSAVRRTAR